MNTMHKLKLMTLGPVLGLVALLELERERIKVKFVE